MGWSRNHQRCISCNSTYFNHKARGLCTKCYRVHRESEKIHKFNDDEFEIQKNKLPFFTIRHYEEKKIIITPKILIKELESKKLKYLRQYGAIESDNINVDVVKLEMILNEIASRCGRKDNLFTNHLMRLNTTFNENQRKIIALKLLEILI